ncbi:hypothetical protein NDU88_004429 [Pleurodeles waltl]|uniref:Uncharacterized protein n=1 Tax=Pleurodeles waltl TaxID=8319 RepID=A0AAV7MUW0_PLEWA|nr:hypothetical protein NDU88_004429 [Pleurodeles waltl]
MPKAFVLVEMGQTGARTVVGKSAPWLAGVMLSLQDHPLTVSQALLKGSPCLRRLRRRAVHCLHSLQGDGGRTGLAVVPPKTRVPHNPPISFVIRN